MTFLSLAWKQVKRTLLGLPIVLVLIWGVAWVSRHPKVAIPAFIVVAFICACGLGSALAAWANKGPKKNG